MRTSSSFIRENWARLAASGLLLAVFFGNSGFRSLVSNWWELRRLRGELAGLERDEAQQEQRLQALQSGDRSLERMARRELGYVKKGEIEYRFPAPPQQDASAR